MAGSLIEVLHWTKIIGACCRIHKFQSAVGSISVTLIRILESVVESLVNHHGGLESVAEDAG